MPSVHNFQWLSLLAVYALHEDILKLKLSMDANKQYYIILVDLVEVLQQSACQVECALLVL